MSDRKNSNGIVNSFVVISEAFHHIDIGEDNIIRFLDNRFFIQMFESIPDFRQQKKIRYKLSNLLMMIFLTVLERGKTSYVIIADVIEAKKRTYESLGLIEDGQCPSHDTIRRVLSLLNAEGLRENTIQAFYFFLQCLERNFLSQGDYKHVAFDGKEMRGSGRASDTKKPKRNTAMLNVYDTGCATVICCEPINEKENEIPVSQELFRWMEFKNSILTADALHCQKETVSLIHAGKGLYLLTVKDNQPLLAEEIKARFDNPKSAKKIKTCEEDERIIEILELPKNYALADEWPGLKAFVRMRSVRNRKNPCVRHFISSTADHRLICDAIEMRWSCESMHRIKDMDLFEDAIRSTDKMALQNIANLNNLAVQLFYLYQAITGMEFRKAKIFFQTNPVDCLNLILGTMSSEEIIDQLISALNRKKKKH